MLLYPNFVPSQQQVYGGLYQIINQYYVCEAWSTLSLQIGVDLLNLNSQSLGTLQTVCFNLTKVFNYIQEIIPQEFPSVIYMENIACQTQLLGANALMISLAPAPGNMQINLNNQSVSSLNTLSQWDPSLSIFQPTNPPQQGYSLVSGITIIST